MMKAIHIVLSNNQSKDYALIRTERMHDISESLVCIPPQDSKSSGCTVCAARDGQRQGRHRDRNGLLVIFSNRMKRNSLVTRHTHQA